jgi:hypothetical protein
VVFCKGPDPGQPRDGPNPFMVEDAEDYGLATGSASALVPSSALPHQSHLLYDRGRIIFAIQKQRQASLPPHVATVHVTLNLQSGRLPFQRSGACPSAPRSSCKEARRWCPGGACGRRSLTCFAPFAPPFNNLQPALGLAVFIWGIFNAVIVHVPAGRHKRKYIEATLSLHVFPLRVRFPSAWSDCFKALRGY